MSVALAERSKMGRPKRVIKTTSIKIEEDANELVRKAAMFRNETVVQYASRILREQARKDLREGAEQFLREDEASKPAAKEGRKGGAK
jgi:hypothetical protein